MLVMLGLMIAYLAWCMKAIGTNADEAFEIGEIYYAAATNREAKIEVRHGDEVLYETVFEED
jgi:hypothetical protein